MKRIDGRAHDVLRDVRVSYNAYGYADVSVLFELGNTKVLCAVTLQNNVPPFLRGTKTGWLTAEYAMLPTATSVRTQREASALKQSGRSVEIARLIGRSLRSMVNLALLGERTITIDCDVLQADGGTRVASITGASLALHKAVQQWLDQGIISENILIDRVAAISAGIMQGHALLDLSFQEDSAIDADFNFVCSRSGGVVEIQGTAEKGPIAWSDFEMVRNLAVQGIDTLFTLFDQEQAIAPQPRSGKHIQSIESNHERVPLFSLKNRLTNDV
jgi:ribonuclease PH